MYHHQNVRKAAASIVDINGVAGRVDVYRLDDRNGSTLAQIIVIVTVSRVVWLHQTLFVPAHHA